MHRWDCHLRSQREMHQHHRIVYVRVPHWLEWRRKEVRCWDQVDISDRLNELRVEIRRERVVLGSSGIRAVAYAESRANEDYYRGRVGQLLLGSDSVRDPLWCPLLLGQQ